MDGQAVTGPCLSVAPPRPAWPMPADPAAAGEVGAPASGLDITGPIPGYWPSAWPCECGGPRRQKLATGPGLAIGPGERLKATVRRVPAERWPVMLVQREPGELYLQGGTRPGQTRASHGWVERIDPVTLEPLAASPELPSGGHNWCGAACVHANGDIYVVNGEYCHRLSPDLAVVAEHRLATRNAHNGHIVLSDGNLAMKDIQIDAARRSVFTVLDPDLREVCRLELPGPSVGRFSADRLADRDHLYATTTDQILRLVYRNASLSLDPDWAAPYGEAGGGRSFAWDSALGDGSAWFMDMGETAAVRAILRSHPIGTQPLAGAGVMRHLPALARLGLNRLLPGRLAFGRPVHPGAQRVYRVSLSDPADRDTLTPFGDAGAAIIAPPLYDPTRRIVVAFDTLNGRLGAWRYEGPGRLNELWRRDWRSSNQPTLFVETGELLVDDCRSPGSWDLVVADIETGRELARADTGCLLSAGMWYTPGWRRDVYTTTPFFGGVARVTVTAATP